MGKQRAGDGNNIPESDFSTTGWLGLEPPNRFFRRSAMVEGSVGEARGGDEEDEEEVDVNVNQKIGELELATCS
jgi:hypothetical protein